jgi:hypothetical protein
MAKFILKSKGEFVYEFESVPAKKGEPTRVVQAGYKRSALLLLQLRNKPVGTEVELDTQFYEGREIVINGRTEVAKAMNEAVVVLMEQHRLEQQLKNLGV